MIERILPDKCYGRRVITPEGIAVHFISDKWKHYGDDPYDLESVLSILRDNNLSYHRIIQRDGTRVQTVQTAPECYRAWHAGESEWNGRPDCNSWMIGVALIGMHGEPFTDPQYDSLARDIAEHVQAHPIKHENIAGHEDIAPDRKNDPGPSFNWDRVHRAIDGLWRP